MTRCDDTFPIINSTINLNNVQIEDKKAIWTVTNGFPDFFSIQNNPK